MADPFWVIFRHTTDLWGCGSAIYLRRGTYDHYVQVCTLVGAKEITGKIAEEKQSDSRKSWGFNFGNLPLKLIGDFSFKETKISEAYRLKKRKLLGSLPNIKEAMDYVENEFLQNDEDIQNLINARKTALSRFVEFQNPTTKLSFKVDLFSQVTTSLSLAEKIDFPQYFSFLNVSLKNHVKKIDKFTLDVEVDFLPIVGN